MTLEDAVDAEDRDALVAAIDAALHVILRESAYAWSVHAVLDALLVVDVLAAGLGRPPPHFSAATVAFLAGEALQWVSRARVEAARAAVRLIRESPRLEELGLMQGSDPDWSEVYAQALLALD